MQTQIIDQIGAVVREVGTRNHAGQPARVVVASRTYDTTIVDLWDALTNAERIPRWFLPISGDLRLGGRYQLEGNAGGEITGCEPPRQLAVTWEMGGAASWVIVTLADNPQGGTHLTLEHLAHIGDDDGAQFWEQFGPGAVGVGWDLALLGLGKHIETGATVDPQAVAAWSGSDEGKTFMRGSSAAWGQASILAGTDEQAALAAAQRTTVFYTGESATPKEG